MVLAEPTHDFHRFLLSSHLHGPAWWHVTRKTGNSMGKSVIRWKYLLKYDKASAAEPMYAVLPSANSKILKIKSGWNPMSVNLNTTILCHTIVSGGVFSTNYGLTASLNATYLKCKIKLKKNCFTEYHRLSLAWGWCLVLLVCTRSAHHAVHGLHTTHSLASGIDVINYTNKCVIKTKVKLNYCD